MVCGWSTSRRSALRHDSRAEDPPDRDLELISLKLRTEEAGSETRDNNLTD